MRAAVFVRIELATDVEDGDFVAAGTNDRPNAGDDVAASSDADERALCFARVRQPKTPRVKPPSMAIVCPVT